MDRLTLALSLALLIAAGPAAAGGGQTTTARAAFMREEIRLARTTDAYLVLDAAEGRLVLRRRHIDLLTIPVRASIGAPRWASTDSLAWPAVAFTLTSSLREPDRPHLEPPRRAADRTADPPVTVEDIQAGRDRMMQSLPARYRLGFTADLDVVVAGESAMPSAGDHWRRGGAWVADAWRGLADRLTGRAPRLRLILTMSPPEARRLYLALEPDLVLLVAPTGGSGAEPALQARRP